MAKARSKSDDETNNNKKKEESSHSHSETKLIESLKSLGADLTKEVLDNEGEPSLDRCQDLLQAIEQETAEPEKMTIAVMEKTLMGKIFGKSIKSFKRHQRTASGVSNSQQQWQVLIDRSERLMSTWKDSVQKEAAVSAQKKKGDNKRDTIDADDEGEGGVDIPGYPKNVRVYHARLVKHKKDLYKDPPVLPPHPITVVEGEWKDLPKRKKSGDFSFEGHPDFTPNRSPKDILQAGSFGGTYFRTIVSGVTGKTHDGVKELEDTVDPEWIKGLDKNTHLCSPKYRKDVNNYPVKCGGSLGMWESSGWITLVDPYGWFQWYCRFFRGRRSSDDDRQISRWSKSAGPKGRFRSQLCNKVIAADTTYDDPKISPVIRQNLLHWGFALTPDHLEKHRNRK
jgi:hypothetical protein